MKKSTAHPDPFTSHLHTVIRCAVRVLAVLMTFVIVMGVVDVGRVLYETLRTPPLMLLPISEILTTFGAFMAVLIAIEIFVNITIYLREDVIPIKVIMATALIAVARKVIILDVDKVEPPYLWGLASVVLAMSIGYWLVVGGPEKTMRKAPSAQADDASGGNESDGGDEHYRLS